MFKNREQAAELLVEKLKKYKVKNVLVLAIPRGAVIMGKLIAKALFAPLDIIVVRKIGSPNNPELAIGAVGPGKSVYWDAKLCQALEIDKKTKDKELKTKNKEREKRERTLRGNKRYPSLKGKTVIVVDDGVATGATSIAAGLFLRTKTVKKAILATPVIAKDTLENLRNLYNEVVYLEAPGDFRAVGQFYEEFPQVSDQEVISIMSS